MCNLSSTTGSNSYGETSWEDGDIATPSSVKSSYKDLISRANNVSITQVFKHYGLHLDIDNHKIICPFKSHKGGRESTASFLYYPETNTFYCFGCHTGRGCCDFVAKMDGISEVKAAHKILELFNSNIVDDLESPQQEDFSERFEIMLSFSEAVRDFRSEHTDPKSLEFIEHVCWVYDTINLKHKLNNDALLQMVEDLKEQIVSYL